MSALLEVPAELLPVSELVARSLTRVEQAFDRAVRSDLPPVRDLVRHVEAYRGKMLRPSLVVLCGLAARVGSVAAEADVSDEHVTIAAVVEMVHMATLVHDDVLDEADVRRKGATVNRLHGNEAAVILGDYLFSAAYTLCSSLPGEMGREATRRIGQTGMALCAGELLQLHHRENFSIDEPTYFEIVRRKTGSLIAIACALGASQSGADGALSQRFADFGLALGVAFQIQDDLLDLSGNQSVVGKPLRRDVALGKLTLPVIHHLAASSPEQRGRTLSLLDEPDPFLGRPGHDLLAALESTRSTAHARAKARELVDAAKATLAPIPGSPAKRLLMLMADQVVNRSF